MLPSKTESLLLSFDAIERRDDGGLRFTLVPIASENDFRPSDTVTVVSLTILSLFLFETFDPFVRSFDVVEELFLYSNLARNSIYVQRISALIVYVMVVIKHCTVVY